MAEWFKAAVLKTVECQSSVGSNPTPSAKNKYQIHGEMAELAEGARLLSECMGKPVPRVRIPVSPPFAKYSRFGQCSRDGFFCRLSGFHRMSAGENRNVLRCAEKQIGHLTHK